MTSLDHAPRIGGWSWSSAPARCVLWVGARRLGFGVSRNAAARRPERTPSKSEEGRGRAAAEPGGGASVVRREPGPSRPKCRLRGAEAGPHVPARARGSLGSLSRLEQSFGVPAAAQGPRRPPSASACCVHPCARRPQGEKAGVPASTRVLTGAALCWGLLGAPVRDGAEGDARLLPVQLRLCKALRFPRDPNVAPALCGA